MVQFHHGHVRALSHATEDPDRVSEAVHVIAPSASLEASDLEGHWGNPILVLEAKLSGGQAKRVAKALLTHQDVGPRILDELAERVDPKGVLHLRFHKQRAAEEALVLVGRGDPDPILLRLNVATYPAKRDLAMAAYEALAEGRDED